jgi:hypothetical protein
MLAVLPIRVLHFPGTGIHACHRKRYAVSSMNCAHRQFFAKKTAILERGSESAGNCILGVVRNCQHRPMLVCPYAFPIHAISPEYRTERSSLRASSTNQADHFMSAG